MVDLVATGWAFVILMVSLSTFFGIAIFIYVGYVKGYPTRAGMKIRLLDFWYRITCRKRKRLIMQYRADLARERAKAHDLEMAKPPEPSSRPVFHITDEIMCTIPEPVHLARYYRELLER